MEGMEDYCMTFYLIDLEPFKSKAYLLKCPSAKVYGRTPSGHRKSVLLTAFLFFLFCSKNGIVSKDPLQKESKVGINTALNFFREEKGLLKL